MSLRSLAGHLKNKLFFDIAYYRYRKAPARRAFLSKEEFETYVSKYKTVEAKSHWNYSDEEQVDLGKERFKMLVKENNNEVPETVCEIGPGSGKLLQQFADAGTKNVYGVDIQKPNFVDERIQYYTDGVHKMENIADNSVDFIYSIDAFEHIPDPIEGFRNCLRKLKPGGKMYIQVGPTYYSPWGFHFYHILKVPYIHILFPEEYLEEYAKKQNKKFPWTNREPATKYVNFFNNLPADAQLLRMKYDYMWYTSGKIIKHSDVFKSRQGLCFDDYFIGAIYAVIKKSDTTDYLR